MLEFRIRARFRVTVGARVRDFWGTELLGTKLLCYTKCREALGHTGMLVLTANPLCHHRHHQLKLTSHIISYICMPGDKFKCLNSGICRRRQNYRNDTTEPNGVITV